MASMVTSPEVDKLAEPPADILDEVEDPLQEKAKTQNLLLLLNEEHFKSNYNTNNAYGQNI